MINNPRCAPGPIREPGKKYTPFIHSTFSILLRTFLLHEHCTSRFTNNAQSLTTFINHLSVYIYSFHVSPPYDHLQGHQGDQVHQVRLSTTRTTLYSCILIFFLYSSYNEHLCQPHHTGKTVQDNSYTRLSHSACTFTFIPFLPYTKDKKVYQIRRPGILTT